MAKIDELIHQPARLRVMATLAALERDADVEFTFLRKHLGLSDGNLGAHLDKLSAAGYIRARKTFVQRRPKTFVRLSRKGRRAFEDYVEALQAVIEDREV